MVMNEKNKINVGFEPNNKKTDKRGEVKEFQLVLEILGKERDKSYSGDWAGKPYFRLKVVVEKPNDWKHLKEIFCFKERLQKDYEETIWNELLADDYIDKRKVVICSKYSQSFSVIRWNDRPKNGGGAK